MCTETQRMKCSRSNYLHDSQLVRMHRLWLLPFGIQHWMLSVKIDKSDWLSSSRWVWNTIDWHERQPDGSIHAQHQSPGKWFSLRQPKLENFHITNSWPNNNTIFSLFFMIEPFLQFRWPFVWWFPNFPPMLCRPKCFRQLTISGTINHPQDFWA